MIFCVHDDVLCNYYKAGTWKLCRILTKYQYIFDIFVPNTVIRPVTNDFYCVDHVEFLVPANCGDP